MNNARVEGDDVSQDRFKIVKKLGEGGFGETYLAEVINRDYARMFKTTTVVLKFPRTAKAELNLNVEGELLAVVKQLKSEHVVRTFGQSVYRGRPVLVLEYARDGSLYDLLGNSPGKRIDPARAVRLARGILRGVAALHEVRIFYRDLKPANVLMDGETAKVADFGLSRFLEEEDLAMSQAGTPPYMSPEILSGAGATFRSDLWAVGVTLYEMLTGARPFTASSSKHLIELICYVPVVPVNTIRPDVPPALSDIVSKSLQKNPDERYATALEMLDALERFERGDIGPPPPPAPPPPNFAQSRTTTVDDIAANAEAATALDRFARDKDPGAAEAALRDVVRRHPDSPFAYLHLGKFFARQQTFQEAARVFQDGLARDAGNALLLYNLGLAYRNTKDSRTAAMFQKAIDCGLCDKELIMANTLLKALRKA